ncbi:hypothetical protein JQX08_01345 [Pseudomonas sp. UL073]|uniref:DUF7281 domain-containing protein n=1 Tax=Zestomonas insulae TaxID=2809017 RepID=A0ABS2I860_9GAMM|nr:hypothetical protein [Pseudomonas insulae]MBM7059341.1 hypothetical protein [Pseudomonas insulae]
MLEFTTQMIEMAAKVIREGKDSIHLNKTWLRIHEFGRVGTRSGTRLTFSQPDRRNLHQLLLDQTGFDAWKDDLALLNQGRANVALTFRNEKLAKKKVREDLVTVSSRSGTVRLASGDYRHPRGGCIQVPFSEIHQAASVVLVENLSVMLIPEEYLWPDIISEEAVLLFRGGPQDNPAAVTQALSGVAEIVAFPDFDPQGLLNSLTLKRCVGIIHPSAIAAQAAKACQRDKPSSFAQQHDARRWLEAKRSIQFVDYMLRDGVAITQESMQGVELVHSRLFAAEGLEPRKYEL